MKIADYITNNRLMHHTSEPRNFDVVTYNELITHCKTKLRYSYTSITRLCNIVEALKKRGLTDADIITMDSHELTEYYTGKPYTCKKANHAIVNRLMSRYLDYLKLSAK